MIPGDLALYNILLFVLVIGFDWIEVAITNTALTLALFIWGIFWFGSVKRYKSGQVKKPLCIYQPSKAIDGSIDDPKSVSAGIFHDLVVYRLYSFFVDDSTHL